MSMWWFRKNDWLVKSTERTIDRQWIAASQRRVTRDGPKKQMGISDVNRSGRPSTEVVVCCEPCVWISGTAWIPGAWPHVGRAGGCATLTGTIHPGSNHSLLHSRTPASGTPSRLQAAGVMSRAVSKARVPRCCVCCAGLPQTSKEVWLSHALVALSRAPSRPWLVPFVQSPSPTRATARCAT
jgi:hypothetical protein